MAGRGGALRVSGGHGDGGPSVASEAILATRRAIVAPSLRVGGSSPGLASPAAGRVRRARRYVLAQAAETLHGLGLRAKGLKGRHIDALSAEWRRQGLSDGTVRHRMAHLRWLARKIGKPGIVRKDNASG